MTERLDDLPPETVNDEQEDADAQAQTVADDALAGSLSVQGLEDSEKPTDPLDPSDVPDLVDRMKQMESSGTIDMDAYRGEENMDDFEGKYGRAAVPDEDFANDDS